MLHTSDFDFELPTELIASHPLAQRDASRMLVVGVESVKFPSGQRGGRRPGCRQLPSNPNLKNRACELRKAGSLPEALLWREISGKKINGLNFNRQKIIGNYIVDFFCPAVGAVIEIDDKSTRDNKWQYDAKREEYLKSLGLDIIHISASDVLKNPSSVAEYLKRHPACCAGTPLARGELVQIVDKHIRDFLDYIRPGDVVVFNNSRVIPARFNASGHEITLHTATNDGAWWGLCKKFNKIPVGEILTMDDGTTVRVIDRNDDSGLKLQFDTDDLFGVLERVGKMPLPPYMKRDNESADRERYQTVYADPIGSMAAPTAGLHFTPELMTEIEARGAKIVKVTLHVGAGTWMPVKTEDLSQHKMHSEWCQITQSQADIINAAKRVIAVGTTSMRTLESAAIINESSNQKSEIRNQKSIRVSPICRTTDIFITPGYKFRAVDVLLTNFHLPKSTLFMLVSAFAGLSNMRAAYAHAVAEKYRFFSYGDCCLLFKNDGVE